jgi:hypothetical protein
MVETVKILNEKLATALVIAVGAVTGAAFVYWLFAILI